MQIRRPWSLRGCWQTCPSRLRREAALRCRDASAEAGDGEGSHLRLDRDVSKSPQTQTLAFVFPRLPIVRTFLNKAVNTLCARCVQIPDPQRISSQPCIFTSLCRPAPTDCLVFARSFLISKFQAVKQTTFAFVETSPSVTSANAIQT